ncbi:hypothetical protein [Devosia sp.]|jgi:hypothetical protein|uniref:hypothetical protein n=1 Tax=Devosia sp. TaxID=1871048 RepID=UPI0037C1AD4B
MTAVERNQQATDAKPVALLEWLIGARRCWFGHRWSYNGPDLPYIGVVGECDRCGARQRIGNPMP